VGSNPGDVILEEDLTRIPVTPTATAATGTATSSTTEVLDVALGTYIFVATGTTRYRVVFAGLKISGSVAGDLFIVNIRNGGSSTPTASSTLITTLNHYIPASGGAGQETVFLHQTFVPSSGTVTLGAFMQRNNGTGVGTPVGMREIYVENMGPA
jgi:hypothetical protein